jgi:hypothetical protein
VPITPHPKSFVLAGRTFDLVCHEGKLRLRSAPFPSFELDHFFELKEGYGVPALVLNTYGRSGQFHELADQTERLSRRRAPDRGNA